MHWLVFLLVLLPGVFFNCDHGRTDHGSKNYGDYCVCSIYAIPRICLTFKQNIATAAEIFANFTGFESQKECKTQILKSYQLLILCCIASFAKTAALNYGLS